MVFPSHHRTNVEQNSEDLGDIHVNDISEIDGFESFNVEHNDPFRGEFNVLPKLWSISLVQ